LENGRLDSCSIETLEIEYFDAEECKAAAAFARISSSFCTAAM